MRGRRKLMRFGPALGQWFGPRPLLAARRASPSKTAERSRIESFRYAAVTCAPLTTVVYRACHPAGSGGLEKRQRALNRLEQGQGVLRIPLCRPGQNAQFAAILANENSGRQTQNFDCLFQTLDDRGFVIGIERQIRKPHPTSARGGARLIPYRAPWY